MKLWFTKKKSEGAEVETLDESGPEVSDVPESTSEPVHQPGGEPDPRETEHGDVDINPDDTDTVKLLKQTWGVGKKMPKYNPLDDGPVETNIYATPNANDIPRRSRKRKS